MQNKKLEECVKYFKDNQGFKRAFDAMRKKYISLGAMGGTVVLQKLAPIEKQALSGLLRKDYQKHSGATLKLCDFQKALEHTKFKGISMVDVLKSYFKEDLISNSDVKQLYDIEQFSFFHDILNDIEYTNGGKWLSNALADKVFGYNSLKQRYDANSSKLKIDLNIVCKALNCLPYLTGAKYSLPVFASRVASNPHALDETTSAGQLFMHSLSYHFGLLKPANASQRAELLYKAGILIDEVSNWVLSCGLIAYDLHNQEHMGWRSFFNRYEPLQSTLLNLSTLSKISSLKKEVFVVENPAVFTSLQNLIYEEHKHNLKQENSTDAQCLYKLKQHLPALVCTYGQVNLAGLVLLDYLAASGAQIWYSGDFDPEGILIADKLKIRYGDSLKLWRYTIEDYQYSISTNCATSIRMKQLDNIKNRDLQLLAQAINSIGFYGYQELLLSKLSEDIKT